MRSNPTATLTVVAETHVPVGSLVTVSIGRNVGPVPLTPGSWDEFRAMTQGALQSFASDTFGPFTGFGEWEGVTEECATFTAITRDPITPSELDRMLSVLADTYGQDAIAYSYGPARLARR